MEDIDVWRTAQLLITLHGDTAPIVAAQRLDVLMASGDLDGRVAWRRIAHAVDELMAKGRPKQVTAH